MVQHKLCRLKKMFRQMYEFEAWLQRELGLSLNEAMTLCTLSGGTLKAGVVAAEVGLSESRMSRVLGSLEKKSLVRREMGSYDRRVMLFCLTAAGGKKLERLEQAAIPFYFCDEAENEN